MESYSIYAILVTFDFYWFLLFEIGIESPYKDISEYCSSYEVGGEWGNFPYIRMYINIT